jgi:hypothetical protein
MEDVQTYENLEDVQIENKGQKMEAKIEFNEENLKQAMSAAVLSTIDDIGRDKILAKAIEHLTTPDKDGYGRNKTHSPIMIAFENASEKLALDIIKKEIEKENSDLNAAIKNVVAKGVEKWLDTDNQDRLAERIASAISSAMSSY